jgi:hypothetical protein
MMDANAEVLWCICGHRACDHLNVQEYDHCCVVPVFHDKYAVPCECPKVIIWEVPIWDDVSCVEGV